MQATKPGKAVFIRLDRIGDLVLTLPADQHPALASTRVSWWVPPGLGFIPAHANPAREFVEVPKLFSWSRFFTLWRLLKRERPDAAVVFHAPWWVGLLLLVAGVRLRCGPLSQWHSFLFFNRGVRQKRSQVRRHELAYNIELVEKGLGLAPTESQSFLSLRPSAPEQVVRQLGLRPRGYFIVHPGMGGSAQNWPSLHYIDLIRRLASHHPVVITGTAGDQVYLAPIEKVVQDQSGVVWLVGALKPDELLDVLAHAICVVAPSTGVLHLAASTGAPTLGLFSPVPVQTAARWGPQGTRTAVISPQVPCPAHFACLREACPHFDCMAGISVEDVETKINTLSAGNERQP